MRISSDTHIVLVLVGLGLVAAGMSGCSTEKPPPAPTGERTSHLREVSRGSLFAEFERSSSRTDHAFSLHAQFVDARGMPADRAMRALEVWSFDPALDADACSLRRRESTPSERRRPDRRRSHRVQLDLLDVGPITVHGPERQLQVEGRRLPDLSSAFSGVIYGLEDARPTGRRHLAYRPDGLYTFRAPGRHTRGAFRITLRAPDPIAFRFPDRFPRRDDTRTIVLSRGRDVAFRWTAGSSSSGDAVFFDVSTGFGPDDLHLKCRLEDDGSFRLPADVLEPLADDTSSLHVALRRVRTKTITIEGFESSRVSLATVDRRRLRLQP